MFVGSISSRFLRAVIVVSNFRARIKLSRIAAVLGYCEEYNSIGIIRTNLNNIIKSARAKIYLVDG
jgi:hypothetical protein